MKLAYLTLAGAALLGSAPEAGAGPLVPNKTVDITFAGFCDGMRLVINENTGLVTGNATGCLSGKVFGTVGSNSKLGAGISILSQGVLYVIDDNPQRFTNYDKAGNVINSGPYTVGVPSPSARSAQSSARR